MHGPGCPVCVTPLELVDKAIALASRPEVIFTSYGDMLRVPGSSQDLFAVKAAGGDVRIVYSPLDALQIARNNPGKMVVFFAIGFETTAPANAMAVLQARAQGLTNFSVLVSHVTVPAAIRALMESPDVQVDGFLAAGHVCTVMGYWEYEPLAEKYQHPHRGDRLRAGGYRPRHPGLRSRAGGGQAQGGECLCPLGEARGEPAAQAVIQQVFAVTDRAWRGIGVIPLSGYRLQEEFSAFDAELRFPEVQSIVTRESEVCISGLVLQGRKKPADCPAFGKECTPQISAGSNDGLLRGRLCSILSLRTIICNNFEKDMNKFRPMTDTPNLLGWTCPRPLQRYPTIVMGHGAGGRMMSDLIEHLFAPAFNNEWLGQMGDSTALDIAAILGSRTGNKLAFTTDSFVVSPLFFPGGNIGELAVFGTVNDLAMRGAKPAFLSAGFILEEGLPMESLGQIVASMASACRKAGVMIATGDTKVVQKGHGDGVYINTSGLGVIPEGIDIAPQNALPGDVVLVSGTMGDHGIAIMSVREGLTFQTEIRSDTAPLNGLVEAMLEAGKEENDTGPAIHCLRDATRGGLAAVLNELAQASSVGIEFDERKVPIRPEVNAACEMLGLDPLYIANEGKLVAILPEAVAGKVLEGMHAHEYGREAAIIGRVVASHPGMVTARTSIGGNRIVDLPAGELLPRIC